MVPRLSQDPGSRLTHEQGSRLLNEFVPTQPQEQGSRLSHDQGTRLSPEQQQMLRMKQVRAQHIQQLQTRHQSDSSQLGIRPPVYQQKSPVIPTSPQFNQVSKKMSIG